MVIVQLLGGMGNQMFQYAMGRALSSKANTALKLDVSVLLDHRPGVHAVNRHFDLDVFSLHADLATPTDIWRYNTHALDFGRKVAGNVYKRVMGDHTIREKSFAFDADMLNRSGDLYLTGTWQSYKYFEAVQDIIRKDFLFKERLSAGAKGVADRIMSSNSVCVNVRRSDYVNVKQTSDILGFVGVEYYKQAIRRLRELFSDLHFFVFSDDLEWCKANLAFIEGPIEFVGHEHAGPKYSHYLQLMTLCKYYVIPNSTFAWWAAWLNGSPKAVIAPARWFSDENLNAQSGDIIPHDWIKI